MARVRPGRAEEQDAPKVSQTTVFLQFDLCNAPDTTVTLCSPNAQQATQKSPGAIPHERHMWGSSCNSGQAARIEGQRGCAFGVQQLVFELHSNIYIHSKYTRMHPCAHLRR